MHPPAIASVAPMMEYTDRYFRYLMRLISRRTLLYTEMVTTAALLHGDLDRLLGFDPKESPLVLQLGGSDPADLAACARLAEQWGYDGVNLNVGCPSDRVQMGRFGACLMAEPELVAECVAAMRDETRLPVSIKTRIGIDHRDSYEHLCEFVGRISDAGCGHFVVHARKAWLQGLSPKENREVPPLRYDVVHRLKQDFPELWIVINGGLLSLDDAATHLPRVDGFMIGRAAYHDPWLFHDVDRRFYGEPDRDIDPLSVLEEYLPFVESQLARGVPLSRMTRPLLGLFQGRPGARIWRRRLSGQRLAPEAGSTPIRRAADEIRHLLQPAS